MRSRTAVAVSTLGSTLRPEGESVRGHAAPSEEASPRTLANRRVPHPAPSNSASAEGVDTASSICERIKIVRATSRFEVNLERDNAVANSLHEALLASRRDFVAVANAVVRHLWRLDGQSLDEARLALGRMPQKAAEWPPPKLNTYALARRVSPDLNAGIASLVARSTETKWRETRWDSLVREKKAPPFYRRDGVMHLRAADVYFGKSQAGTTLRFTLRAGKGQRLELPLKARDDSQELVLAMLLDGRAKHGTVAIEQDRRRPRRWYIRIAYTRFVERKTEGIAAAINRGIVFFLVGVTAAGQSWCYDGNDIEAYLRQIQRRRRSYQHDSKASDRWGHGRVRTLRPIEHLAGKAGRWRETRCQTIARRFALWCQKENVSRVYIEDFSGIRAGDPDRLEGGPTVAQRIHEWPYHQLGSRIVSCCQELGIEVTEVPPEYISQTCPRCGSVSEANRDLKTWKLRCAACRYIKHLDVAAAMNVLARGETKREVPKKG